MIVHPDGSGSNGLEGDVVSRWTKRRPKLNPMSERIIANRLTIAYVAGLTLIGVLACTIHILLDSVIVQQRDAGTIINVAGRQRMLSQRIALLATDLDAGDASAREKLLDAADQMERSQNALTRAGDLNISRPASADISEYYFEGEGALDPKVRTFIAAARRFGEAPEAADAGEALAIVRRGAHESLLPALEIAVSLFEERSIRRIDQLRMIQKIVLGVLITTLILEGLLIFRPLVIRVRHHANQLFTLATRDVLTGLVNRAHFLDLANEAFDEAKRTGSPVSLIILDLDHFKRINDTYGHAVGDEVLRQFATIATAMLRRTDHLARIGGEEFALTLKNTGPKDAMVIAEKLRQAMAEHRADNIPDFTISVGLATLEPGDKAVEDLLRRADTALYEAKRRGRDRVAIFDSLLGQPMSFAAAAPPG